MIAVKRNNTKNTRGSPYLVNTDPWDVWCVESRDRESSVAFCSQHPVLWIRVMTSLGNTKQEYRCAATLYFVRQVLAIPLSSLGFGSRNSPTTGILRHVYRSVWPSRDLRLALGPRSNVLRMIVKLAWRSGILANRDRHCIWSVSQFEFVHPRLANAFEKASNRTGSRQWLGEGSYY